MGDSLLYKRNYALDIARIVAVLAVVMTHCGVRFVTNYSPFTNEFVWGNLCDSLSRMGAPLFFMISGSLFLDERKEVTLKGILSKIKSLAIITIIWAILYSAIDKVIFPILASKPVNVRNFINGIINGHYHMWYLYVIIGLYITTPFLKKFVCKENKGMVLTFIGIAFCYQFIAPVINAMCKLGINLSFINTFTDKFLLDFFGGYITYFVVGWYIVHIGIEKKWARCLVYSLGAVSLVSIILYVHFTGDYKNAYENISAPVFFCSVSVFLALNNINWDLKEKTAKIVVGLSKLTFGAYIVHVMVLTVYNKLFPYNKYSALYILGCFVIVVIISFLISYIVSKIPILRKIIKA